MPSPRVILDESEAAALSPPPTATMRWSPRRKAAVVLAARSGIISREEAYRRYQLSPEELAAWEAALDENGVAGLRSTRQQNYRRARQQAGEGAGAETG
jgi:Protein of unknown function (DUF1153)